MTDNQADRKFINRTVLGIVLGLGSIIALQTVSFLIQRVQIARELDTSTIVSLSANQRMLSQRVPLLALALMNVQSEVTREKAKKALLGELDRMEKSHLMLIAGDPAGGIRAEKSEKVRNIFFSDPHALDRKVRDFLETAKRVSIVNGKDLNPRDPDLLLLTEKSSELSQIFQHLTAQYRQEGIEGIIGIENLTARLFAAQIGLIMITALLVFYPLIKRLKVEFQERTNAQIELLDQNRELELFASTVAHDLKAPLNNIGGFSQFLKDKVIVNDDKETREILDLIGSGVNRMTQMIDELLQYARLTRKRRRLESVSLNQLVDKVIGDFEKNIKDQNARIEVEALPVIVADRLQLEHLFMNLISNALKYTHPARTPHITINQLRNGDNENMVHFYVEDNGRGFPEGLEEKMFEPFRRLNPHEKIEGSGFGLALCRKITRAHKGNITVEHAANGGSRFIVSLSTKLSRTY